MDEAIREHTHALLLQTLRDVFEGGTMKRCRICKGLGDVRGDGLCGGCYDNHLAGEFGLSYGKFVALYGHNFLRRNYPPGFLFQSAASTHGKRKQGKGKLFPLSGRACQLMLTME